MKQRKTYVQIQRKLGSAVKTGWNISESLKDCSPEKAAVVRDVISMNVLERCVVHVCYDKDVVWNGRILRVERKMSSKDPLLVVNWQE